MTSTKTLASVLTTLAVAIAVIDIGADDYIPLPSGCRSRAHERQNARKQRCAEHAMQVEPPA
jgi:hypothetical protein